MYSLGQTKSEMPFTPSGAPAHSRQHQVHDVVGQIVLAVGDEDLGAEELVAAVGLRLGPRAHQRQIDPACGSVRFIEPVQRAVDHRGM
jgi:hypothetical protein